MKYFLVKRVDMNGGDFKDHTQEYDAFLKAVDGVKVSIEDNLLNCCTIW
jgi:hypothetical protein